jgi:hypothetical protein
MTRCVLDTNVYIRASHDRTRALRSTAAGRHWAVSAAGQS